MSNGMRWLYIMGGIQYGPVTTEELQNLINIKKLHPSALVCAEGFAQWVPANSQVVITSGLKKSSAGKIVGIVVAVFIGIGILSSINGGNDEKSSVSGDKVTAQSDVSIATTPVVSKKSISTPNPTPTPMEPETILYEAELTSGYYVSGIDFPEGRYDITAMKGSGNVQSSNMFDGGINAIMGSESEAAANDMYELSYQNIGLPEGVTLSVKGVTIKIASDKASSKALVRRNQLNLKTIKLTSGNFIFGEDIDPGIYDIKCIEGSGNVQSSNMFDGGINAIMGSESEAAANDMYELEYKNVSLSKDITLEVKGVTIELTPSK